MANNNTKKDKLAVLVKAIDEEVKKAADSKNKIGILDIHTANEDIIKGLSQADPKFFYNRLVVEHELIFCYAESNAGKSLLCVQIAESIAKTDLILYLDCELSIKQFQRRYTDKETGKVHVFPENFHHAVIDKSRMGTKNLSEAILDSIELAAIKGYRFIFVDNLTYLCSNAEKGEVAVQFMHKLIALKQKYKLTLLVVAHTPKRSGKQPITANDLYGSSRLIQLADSAFAIGISAKDPALRYIKTTKYRAGEYPYPADRVAVCSLEQIDCLTGFVFLNYATEREHLREKNSATEAEEMQTIVDLKSQGKSFMEIKKLTGIPKTSAFRIHQKAIFLGVVPTQKQTSSPDKTSFRSTNNAKQLERNGTNTRQKNKKTNVLQVPFSSVRRKK